MSSLRSVVFQNLNVRWDLGNGEEKSVLTLPTIRAGEMCSSSTDQDLHTSTMKDSIKTVKVQVERDNSSNINSADGGSISSGCVIESQKVNTAFDEELAYKMSTSFVAAILASGAATFMEYQNDEEPNRWTSAQVSILLWKIM